MIWRQIKNSVSLSKRYLSERLSKLFANGDQTPVEHIRTKRKTQLTPKKQEKLEELCKQLFKQKELITSGKLQLIGLQKIKKRMGKKWQGLSRIVYETTESVIDEHMGKGDIFIRYKDDSYVIIFAHADPGEARLKAAIIAKEIQDRLFALDEEELRDLEIRQAIGQIKTDMFMEAGFLDDMSAMDSMFDDLEDDPDLLEDEGDPLADVKAVEIETETQSKETPATIGELSDDISNIEITYLPLWDTKRGALSTYLCLAKGEDDTDNFFAAQQELYKNADRALTTTIDIHILRAVGEELSAMAEDGRKFFLVCPVNHETVYHMEHFEAYKKALEEIPMKHRKFLLLFVMSVGNTQPPKNAYWFAKPLRTLCPHIFADIPLRRDVNFSYLSNAAVDVAGVRLSKDDITEPEIISLLNALSAKAKAANIKKTFALDVSSLSITTSAVCAGLDFLGGTAIHGLVEKPDNMHRYHHADLIKQLSSG
jgi:hypothetical protein